MSTAQENSNATPTGTTDKDTQQSTEKQMQQQQKHQSQSSEASGTGTHELATAVDDLLDQLEHKFDGVSSEIFGKLDDMARRLDELESSLAVAGEAAPANQTK